MLAVGFLALTTSSVRAQDEELRFDGEYGLYVRVVDDGLEVRWITAEAGPGMLHAFVESEEIERVRTASAQTHFVFVETLAPEVTLVYGADGGEAHRTAIVREPRAEPEIEIDGVETAYMFGDVHGEFDRVVGLLRNARLIDEELEWAGGDSHLVFLGDIFDRGDDVTRVLWFLYRLEREAAQAGGAVHVVLGNHEVMVMSDDDRYVGFKETAIAQAHGVKYAKLFDPHDSVLGRWLAHKPGLVRMEDLLLAHGGVSPEYRDYTLQGYQDSLRTFIDEELFKRWGDQEYLDSYGEDPEPDEFIADSLGVLRRWNFFFEGSSVLWFRDLVQSDTLGVFLDEVLEHFDTKVHVVGHTPVKTIREMYDGKLIATDLEEAATELLHLARRKDGGWDRYRIPLLGEPTPLAELHSER